jgi:hypothetical protein
VLSQFRASAAQQPDDLRFATIVAELTEAGPEFRTWWAMTSSGSCPCSTTSDRDDDLPAAQKHPRHRC